MERARGSKPGDMPSSSILPGTLPSFASMGVIPELAGKGAGAVAPPVPSPHPQQPQARGRKRKNQQQQHQQQQQQQNQQHQQQQQNRKRGPNGLPLQLCWICGKPGHVAGNCPSGKGKRRQGPREELQGLKASVRH